MNSLISDSHEGVADERKIMYKTELLKSLHELKGKVLGCYCKPEACHGNILVELIDEL